MTWKYLQLLFLEDHGDQLNHGAPWLNHNYCTHSNLHVSICMLHLQCCNLTSSIDQPQTVQLPRVQAPEGQENEHAKVLEEWSQRGVTGLLYTTAAPLWTHHLPSLACFTRQQLNKGPLLNFSMVAKCLQIMHLV